LVASLSGLGHTARLARLARKFQQLGHQVQLVTGEKQASILGQGLSMPILKIDCLLPNWIDGPHSSAPTEKMLSESTRYAILQIEKADSVLSDNVAWPIDFNPKTVIYSHFLWVDYYFATQAKTLEGDLTRLSRLACWMRPRDFRFESQFEHLLTTVDTKLPRFQAFHAVSSRPKAREAWLAFGKTGQNIPRIEGLELGGLRVIHRETFHLTGVSELPMLILGRPGMGSIGESLSAGIPFIPFFQGRDPELVSNGRHLFRMGVSPVERYESSRPITDNQLFGATEASLHYSRIKMVDEMIWAQNIIDRLN